MDKKIIYKYTRKDFFGGRTYTEDISSLTEQTLKKAFSAMKKDGGAAIELNGLYYTAVTIYWDTFTDHNNEITTVRFYDKNHNCTIERMAFTKIKRIITDYMKNNQAA